MAGTNQTFNSLVPFLRPEEEDFVSLDGTADGVAVVVTAELILGAGGATRLQLGVIGIQLIVAARIKNAAMEVIFA